MTRPRREYVFNTVQSSSLSDYVPDPTRDPERRAIFEGGNQGIVVAWLQKVGAIAAERTFSEVAGTNDAEQITDAADLFATAAMGTAYHTFAQHHADEVMFRRINLPRMFDPESGKRTSQEELIEKAQLGLMHAAELASIIEEMVREGRNSKLLTKKNLTLGRSLATTGVALSVVRRNVAGLQLSEFEAQEEAMWSAQASYDHSGDLTRVLGVRPTIAQFADNRSPFMQYLNTDKNSVMQPVYEKLVAEIKVAEEQSLRAAGR